MSDLGPRRALAAIAMATLLSMSMWFSASFVLPQLEVRWAMTTFTVSFLTIAVQLGFVVGALASAILGISDLIRGTRLMAIGAVGAALCNATLLIADTSGQAIVARAGTGLFLALVYPPALKEVAGWFRGGRGLALGVMVGALTVGSGLPHLVSALVEVDWRTVIGTTSLCGLAGGAVALTCRRSGPYLQATQRFRPRDAFRSLRHRPVALANIGYVGHMWELYAMWAFVGTFLAQVPALQNVEDPTRTASLIAFVCIACGALGCLLGGVIGDRRGHAKAALVALSCSGGAAIVLVFIPSGPLWLIAVVCAWWGFWVIADSAQFSALVAQHASPAHLGSALSAQLAFGYLTTAVTIWLVPAVAVKVGWSWSIGLLAIGPAIGVLAMFAITGGRTVPRQSITNEGHGE